MFTSYSVTQTDHISVQVSESAVITVILELCEILFMFFKGSIVYSTGRVKLSKFKAAAAAATPSKICEERFDLS